MGAIDASFRIDWPGFALDVDVTLPAKGVTALFGPSGSGKTTLLRCIAGLERPSHGRLTVGGEVWQDGKLFLPTHKRALGYVFQEASLFPHLTVMDNLRYGLRRMNCERRVSLDHTIDLLGIGHLLERRPDHLSGGERQRVGIARALAVGSCLLLMDEPLAALDLKRKQEILPYLERLRDELEIPILYVSHAADEVMRLADHIVVMDGGRVRTHGPLAETLSRLDLSVRLDDEAGVILEATVGEVAQDWHLARVDFEGGSLWTRYLGTPLGKRVRVRILARDVSLARERPAQVSIQNLLRGQVDAIAGDGHPGLLLVRMQVGSARLIARLTKRAAAELAVSEGEDLWVQVKTVALME